MTTPDPEPLCKTCDGRRWVNADRPGINPCPDCGGDRAVTATGQTGSDAHDNGREGER